MLKNIIRIVLVCLAFVTAIVSLMSVLAPKYYTTGSDGRGLYLESELGTRTEVIRKSSPIFDLKMDADFKNIYVRCLDNIARQLNNLYLIGPNKKAKFITGADHGYSTLLPDPGFHEAYNLKDGRLSAYNDPQDIKIADNVVAVSKSRNGIFFKDTKGVLYEYDGKSVKKAGVGYGALLLNIFYLVVAAVLLAGIRIKKNKTIIWAVLGVFFIACVSGQILAVNSALWITAIASFVVMLSLFIFSVHQQMKDKTAANGIC